MNFAKSRVFGVFVLVVLFECVSGDILQEVSRYFSDEPAHVAYQRYLDLYLKTQPEHIAMEAKMDVPDLVRYKGYPIETHHVVTVDGYILTIHRIPYGKNDTNIRRTRRPVVFLQHCLLCSSAEWIMTGLEHSFGYLLADNGYDVWMGNFRGNTYSRNHTTLDPDVDKQKFWNFSWHEMGVIDLPTMIDYVLRKTRTKRLFHVGHSQGTTTFYVMTSERPEYNKKIRAHFSLSPVAFMKHAFCPACQFLAEIDKPLRRFLEKTDRYEFLPQTNFLLTYGRDFCGRTVLSHLLCTNSLFSIIGFNPRQYNRTRYAVIFGHTPAGCSIDQFVHYGQLIKVDTTSKFRQYDHGILGNLERYGSLSPPDYKLENIVAPMFLFYSTNDWLSNVNDVSKLYRKIKSPIKRKILVPDRWFNHMDFLYGNDAPTFVYRPVLKLMKYFL